MVVRKEPDAETSMAAVYEKTTRISVPSYDALFTMVRAYFRMLLGQRPADLLVVGVGGGNELSAWGPSNPAWTFTGVDPSEEMLRIAQQKAEQLGMTDRVNLIQGTIDHLPLSDSKFDAASCILVLHFIDDDKDKFKLLATVREHLKPQAPFVLVTAYGDRDDAEFQDRLNVWRSFWLDGGREPSTVDEMLTRGILKLSIIPESQIERLLVKAGFTNITRFYSTGLFGGWLCHAG